jgi:CRP/FNR family transcriptional regulator, cyclic AMP receptor protein
VPIAPSLTNIFSALSAAAPLSSAPASRNSCICAAVCTRRDAARPASAAPARATPRAEGRWAGEANEALFLLKTGRVQIVCETAEGKRLVSAVLGPHTFFGEMALVGQRFPQDSTAESVEDALICVLSRKDLERLIMQHPKVGLRFLEQLSARLLETEAIVADFAFKSVPARLAGALLRLAETTQDQTIHASHQELADMIAAYRETVTLTLDEFQTRGLVELGRRSIDVLDRPALEALAAG